LCDGWSASVKKEIQGDKREVGTKTEKGEDGSRARTGVGWKLNGWRAWGLQAITFGLLGLKELDRERNELLREQNELQREQNSYLHRIAKHLESGLGPEEMEVLVEDSTMRE